MSFRRTISSQQNGRLSHGPSTQNGKDRCAAAALRHGLLAKSTPVLDNENHHQYDALLDRHHARFQTQDAVEDHIVGEMVSAAWRLGRLTRIENRMMDQGIEHHTAGDDIDRTLAAFAALADSPQYKLLLRYEAQLHNTYARCLRTLAAIKKFSVPSDEPAVSVPAQAPPPPSAGAPAPEPKPLTRQAAVSAQPVVNPPRQSQPHPPLDEPAPESGPPANPNTCKAFKAA